jgi:hypothetical protein
MNIMDLYVTIAVQLVAFVVWIARLEMKVKYLQETHDVCKLSKDAASVAKDIADALAVTTLNNITKQLAELSTDVKWLISSRNGGPGGKSS